MVKKRYYAGIGSRETPKEFKSVFYDIAHRLEHKGYTLRSGGADGADVFFEQGIKNKEIFLPWEGFNKNESKLFEIPEKAFKIAEKYHPAWEKLNDASRKFMARNCMQVLGKDLETPSDFIVCWTPKGEMVGGTAQALRIAKDLHISVFNFGNGLTIDQFWNIIDFII